MGSQELRRLSKGGDEGAIAFLARKKAFLPRRRAFRLNRKAFRSRKRAFRSNRQAFRSRKKAFRLNWRAFRLNRQAFRSKRKAADPVTSGLDSCRPGRHRGEGRAEGSGRADLSSAQILQSLGLLQDDRWGPVAWTDKVELRAKRPLFRSMSSRRSGPLSPQSSGIMRRGHSPARMKERSRPRSLNSMAAEARTRRVRS